MHPLSTDAVDGGLLGAVARSDPAPDQPLRLRAARQARAPPPPDKRRAQRRGTRQPQLLHQSLLRRMTPPRPQACGLELHRHTKMADMKPAPLPRRANQLRLIRSRVKPSGEKYFSSVFQKFMIVSAHPASTGGAYRDRHGRGKRGAVDAKVFSAAKAAPTKALLADERNRVVPISRGWDQVLRDEPRRDGG
jgi:hypothetical protein